MLEIFQKAHGVNFFFVEYLLISDMSQLAADVLEWLLEESNPSVRFWALQQLEGKSPSSSEVQEAQASLMGTNPVKAILDAQDSEGYWVDSENMYLPKYRATTHSLLILAELGAEKTSAIEKGIEHVLTFQRDSGHFLPDMPKTIQGRASIVKDGCCFDGNILYYMIHFGYLADSRVQRLIDFMVDYHSMDSAGWRCRAYPINPNGVFSKNCYMGAVKSLRALARIPDKHRSEEVRRIIDREVENILENRVFKYLRAEDGSRKDKAGWKRFGFPLFYQSDALEVLDVLTSLGVRDDRMQEAVDLVEDARGPDGRWALKGSFNGKMWVDIEVKGKPSKWITLRALRTLKRYYQ